MKSRVKCDSTHSKIETLMAVNMAVNCQVEPSHKDENHTLQSVKKSRSILRAILRSKS